MERRNITGVPGQERIEVYTSINKDQLLLRRITGILSVVLALLFLLPQLLGYIEQLLHPNRLWLYMITLKEHLGSWLAALLLLVSGIWILRNSTQAQYSYFLFGIMALLDTLFTIERTGSSLIQGDALLPLVLFIVLPIVMGIWFLLTSSSNAWIGKYGWKRPLKLKQAIYLGGCGIALVLLPRLLPQSLLY